MNTNLSYDERILKTKVVYALLEGNEIGAASLLAESGIQNLSLYRIGYLVGEIEGTDIYRLFSASFDRCQELSVSISNEIHYNGECYATDLLSKNGSYQSFQAGFLAGYKTIQQDEKKEKSKAVCLVKPVSTPKKTVSKTVKRKKTGQIQNKRKKTGK